MTEALERLTAALTDRYAIERELGAGGMATVYLAHDVKHNVKAAAMTTGRNEALLRKAMRFRIEPPRPLDSEHVVAA